MATYLRQITTSCVRPSSHGKKILVWPGLRAVAFSCRFWKPHHTGEVLPKFWIDTKHWSMFAGN
jgi:hypothetical protein